MTTDTREARALAHEIVKHGVEYDLDWTCVLNELRTIVGTEQITMLAKALLAATDAQGTCGWQPIETAPKDGTRVLVFDRKYGVNYIGCCYARPLSDGTYAWTGGSAYAEPEGNWTAIMQPSHWAPLPSPPADHQPRPTPADAPVSDDKP